MSALSNYLNTFNILKQIPIFAGLNLFDLHKIASKAIIEEYKKGEILCEEGTPPDFLYCLVSGRVQAYTRSEDGQKENFEFIHRGTHFGIISLLTGESHAQNFEAINDSIVLKIEKEEFARILKAIPHLGVLLSQTLSKRIHKSSKGTKSVFESSIISVYSPIKGTGCSTYAVNLAFSLSRETSKKVILIHISEEKKEVGSSGEGCASPRWKLQPIALDQIVDSREKIRSKISHDETGIDLINITIDKNNPSLAKQISPFVTELVGDYHFVVVDLPSSMDEVVLETLTQSDLIHLLVFDKEKDLGLLRQVVHKVKNILANNFSQEKIRVIVRSETDSIYLSFEEIDQAIDYPVYTMLPIVRKEELTQEVDTACFSFFRPDSNQRYSKTTRRIAREIGKVRVGIALGGGAALGLAHIGVIKVLEENNIPIDVIVGSSMGALIGGLWALGKDAKELERIAEEFKYKKNLIKLFDPVFPISGIVGGALIKRWLRKHFGSSTFYGVKTPLKIVVYDLWKREDIVLYSGSLVDAVRQSISIPGVMEPVKKDGRLIIDGGVLNPLPTNVLASMGISKIISVNVLQSPEQSYVGSSSKERSRNKKRSIPFWKNPWHYVTFRCGQFFRKTFNPNISDIIVNTLQASEYILAEQNSVLADVAIHPDLGGFSWWELDQYPALIKRGEEATQKKLQEIQDLIGQ
jgi:predicted acylesterase/phospholipase RssA/cellulose biosynthesis protein BcsQ